MVDEKHHEMDEPCTESKLLALHTAIVCLARTLATSGQLDRNTFNQQLDAGRQWLQEHDHEPGHNTQAFDQILEMLRNV